MIKSATFFPKACLIKPSLQCFVSVTTKANKVIVKANSLGKYPMKIYMSAKNFGAKTVYSKLFSFALVILILRQ